MIFMDIHIYIYYIIVYYIYYIYIYIILYIYIYIILYYIYTVYIPYIYTISNIYIHHILQYVGPYCHIPNIPTSTAANHSCSDTSQVAAQAMTRWIVGCNDTLMFVSQLYVPKYCCHHVSLLSMKPWLHGTYSHLFSLLIHISMSTYWTIHSQFFFW